MRSKNIFLFLSLLAVVAVSGCISNFGFGPQQQTVEAPNDVLSFSDATIIPNPPILTGDTFTTSFTIKNLDALEDAKNAKLELYDWGVCEPSSCTPDINGVCSEDLKDISPQDVQQKEYQFKSPSSEKIGGMPAECPIRFKLAYAFSGITTTDLNVISNKKFQDMQRAGQTPSMQSVQSKSRGPIKVDFSFGVNQPVRTSTIDNTNLFKSNIVKIPMYITVENKGSGKISQLTETKIICQEQHVTGEEACRKINGKCKESSCKGGCKDFPSAGDCNCNAKCELNFIDLNITIKLPASFTSSGKASECGELTCDGFFVATAQETGNCELTLNAGKKIDFAKGKSQTFRCELTSPDESVVSDEKTFSIQSEVDYTYQIDNEFSVQVKPMVVG